MMEVNVKAEGRTWSNSVEHAGCSCHAGSGEACCRLAIASAHPKQVRLDEAPTDRDNAHLAIRVHFAAAPYLSPKCGAGAHSEYSYTSYGFLCCTDTCNEWPNPLRLVPFAQASNSAPNDFTCYTMARWREQIILRFETQQRLQTSSSQLRQANAKKMYVGLLLPIPMPDEVHNISHTRSTESTGSNCKLSWLVDFSKSPSLAPVSSAAQLCNMICVPGL